MQISINRRILIFFTFLFVLYAIYIVIVGLSNSTINNFSEFRRTKHEIYRDWNDYKFMLYEEARTGPGERGEPVFLENEDEIKLNEEFIQKTGFSVVVSDKISVNRSLPNVVHPDCMNVKYYADLPKVSVIIIFYNEVMSVLLRTIHSVYNRTPNELLHEIILVNDHSTEDYLHGKLHKYLEANFPKDLIKVKELSKRSGLIVARMEGARAATGEVLVFFDSHVEVQPNYLPPLLQPLVKNRKIATLPIVDYFDCRSFEFYPGQENVQGTRGVIDWVLDFHEFDKLKEDVENPIRPFPNPIMLGCAFAIDRKFFVEELGGYDEELRIWNGENYELSFKLWMCRDGLFTVPCSRIAHSFRDINPSRNIGDDFVARNFKRIAEVWLDEFKTLLYENQPERYKSVDAGDLTKPKKIREQLGCKPFRWFLKNVAPDMVRTYPPISNKHILASGAVQSVANPQLCLDNGGKLFGERVILYDCSNDLQEPTAEQKFTYTFLKDIKQRVDRQDFCLDAYNLNMFSCNGVNEGNQIWKYDRKTKEIFKKRESNPNENDCITADLQKSTVLLAQCNGDMSQQWNFGYVNHTAFEMFDEALGYIGAFDPSKL